MSEFLQMLQTNQGIITTILFIVVINLGLILTALIMGTLNYIRTNQRINRTIIQENQIQNTLEDLIQRDLIERTIQTELTDKKLEQITAITDKELLKIMEEITEEKIK